eukprot:9224304-Pyramimonas_sp.AAC.1
MLRWRRQSRACALVFDAQARWRAHMAIEIKLTRMPQSQKRSWWDAPRLARARGSRADTTTS